MFLCYNTTYINSKLGKGGFVLDSPNYFEFSVKKKKTANTWLLQFAIVFLSFLPMLIMFIFFIKVIGYVMFLFLLGAIVSIWFFMRFTRVEYEYIIAGGEISFSAVYDNVQRRKIVSAKIKDMTAIAPYDEQLVSRFSEGVAKRFDLCIALDSYDVYFFTYNHDKLGKILVTFNMAGKAAQIMNFYNRSTVLKGRYHV